MFCTGDRTRRYQKTQMKDSCSGALAWSPRALSRQQRQPKDTNVPFLAPRAPPSEIPPLEVLSCWRSVSAKYTICLTSDNATWTKYRVLSPSRADRCFLTKMRQAIPYGFASRRDPSLQVRIIASLAATRRETRSTRACEQHESIQNREAFLLPVITHAVSRMNGVDALEACISGISKCQCWKRTVLTNRGHRLRKCELSLVQDPGRI